MSPDERSAQYADTINVHRTSPHCVVRDKICSDGHKPINMSAEHAEKNM